MTSLESDLVCVVEGNNRTIYSAEDVCAFSLQGNTLTYLNVTVAAWLCSQIIIIIINSQQTLVGSVIYLLLKLDSLKNVPVKFQRYQSSP